MQHLIVIAVAGWLIAAGGPALAHAFLTIASPAVGGTVAAMPSEVTLRFSENVEPAFCTATVTAPDGTRVDSGSVSVDPADPALLRIALKPLAAGKNAGGDYKVVWRAVSVDTHVTNGSFTFTVAP